MASDIFEPRKTIIRNIFILVSVIFIIRLLYLQVIDSTYAQLAENNVLRELTIYPARGLIYDRNGELIVQNNAIYDLMVVPEHVVEMDTVFFCELLEIDHQTFIKNFSAAKRFSRNKPSVFLKQIPAGDYAKFQEYLFQFPGFYPQVRTVRKYPSKSASHILGYIGEVNKKQIEESNNYYRSGDYIGIKGIEYSYEKELRGKNGKKFMLVDVHNREQGSYLNGTRDLKAVSGKNLLSSLDIELQKYGELLMQNKIGSIVAIDPSTGEILAIISSPDYDPNLLTGRKRGENFMLLSNDPLKPLYNRAIMAKYPPGSPFKPLMALIGLQEKAINPNATYSCNGGYHMKGLTVKCLAPGRFNMQRAIEKSCNAYFCNLYRKIIDQKKYASVAQSFDNWRNYLLSFGLGTKLGIDIPNEVAGLLPSVQYYDNIYGENRWKSSTTISLAIGQGELGVTPLQMANYMCSIANKGYYYIPRLITGIINEKDTIRMQSSKKYTLIDPIHYSIIIDAMEGVVLRGTARIAKIEGLAMCGKTGSAENPHGDDHSFFAGFAPKENPKIAIMVIVENSGFGATYAAPIGSLVVEKYLSDTISRSRVWLEQRMLKADIIHKDPL